MKAKMQKFWYLKKKKRLLSLFPHKRQMRFHLLTFLSCLHLTQANVRTSWGVARGGGERERERHDNFTSWQSSAY